MIRSSFDSLFEYLMDITQYYVYVMYSYKHAYENRNKISKVSFEILGQTSWWFVRFAHKDF